MKVQFLKMICLFVLLACAATAFGFDVGGAIGDKWHSLGGDKGFLGAPINNETGFEDKHHGRYQNFFGGSIVWSPQTGAHVINHDQILAKWTSLSDKLLGYPVIDVTIAPDGNGRFVHCENGSIYWSPETPASEVHGAIRDKWAALLWERGRLGYPTSDEYQDGQYRRSNFAGGFIRWTPQQGAHETFTSTY